MPSDLAALSVSDDFTNVDALKVFRAVVSAVQILNSFLRPLRRLLMLLLSQRHSSSRNIGANERWIPRRHGAFSIGPLSVTCTSLSSCWCCAKDLGANEISNSATSRGPRTWTMAQRVTSTALRIRSKPLQKDDPLRAIWPQRVSHDPLQISWVCCAWHRR